MTIEEILEYLKNVDTSIDQRMGIGPPAPAPYATNLDLDGYLRLIGNGNSLYGAPNADSIPRTPYDVLDERAPGLIDAWKNEARVNKQPVPSYEESEQQYNEMIKKKPRTYKGTL